MQRNRKGRCSTPTQELNPVGRKSMDRFVGDEEGYSLTKFSVVGVGSQ
jgi:hypothetical protein